MNKRSITIISHANANSGTIDRYEEFLIRQGHTVTKVSHPLDNYQNGNSVLWQGGKKVASIARKDAGLRNLLADIKLTVQLLRKVEGDILIGANNFDTCIALLLRKLHPNTGKRVIYFASDFSEQRFANPLLDAIYYRIERNALKRADITISNTQRAETKRKGLGLDTSKSIVVPNTAYIEKPNFHPKNIQKGKFIYVGALAPEHGLFDFIAICHSIITELVIVGDGPDRGRILRLCKDKKINVTYLGQKEHGWTIAFRQGFEGIGIAPHNLKAAKYVYYGSSLKVFEYLACGLPVITSDVTEQSNLVSIHNLGIVYSALEKDSLASALQNFDLTDFHERAKKFYELFNQETQYQRIPL